MIFEKLKQFFSNKIYNYKLKRKLYYSIPDHRPIEHNKYPSTFIRYESAYRLGYYKNRITKLDMNDFDNIAKLSYTLLKKE